MALPLVTHARTRIFFGEKLTTVRLSNSEYLIGVELANLLRRETYNLYRSLKLLQIDVIRCVPSQVEALASFDAIKRGIHSVSLVPLEAGLAYIEQELCKKPRRKTLAGSKRKLTSSSSSFGSSDSNPSSPSSSSVAMETPTPSDESLAFVPDDYANPWKRLLSVVATELNAVTVQ